MITPTGCFWLAPPALALALLVMAATALFAQQTPLASTGVVQHPTVKALKAWPAATEGTLVQTSGYHTFGDGGGASYRLQQAGGELQANESDVIALNNGLVAVLVERAAVNYRMFGAVGDGEHDDGVQIKRAHEYANEHRVPVVNLSGEYWIKQTNSIPIQTNVSWGTTRFHIDERYNSNRLPRFIVMNDEPTQTLALDGEAKAALLARIRPGVQIIPELAQYAGHLIVVQDTEDRIGIRAGYEGNRGWAREELFYVEEEGRIIGDIAWGFKDFTSVTATPCNDVYLIIEGGGFYVSGDTPESGVKGYHQNGFSIQRSRTIIRQQWVGLEKGRRDDSLEPRSGFYSLSRVYDVTLDNIRAMPWEKDRPGTDRDVAHGTYGIGGARMLNCTFRNITAEAGWAAWGVFGTNLNKNFRIENCQLNRIDVHFHCWNLYIKNCIIGFKGISVTGGGDLFIEDTVRHGNNFIAFRYDYGAKWDGRIRLRGCTLRPVSNGGVSVLSYRLANFDYQYPLGFGRSISIEDLVIDYGAVPTSTAQCWLLDIVPFSRTNAGNRLVFPSQVEFRNIRVEGREQGVRLASIPSPQHYDVGRPGGYDGARLTPNSTITVENVQLEKLTPERPGDTANVHLLLGGEAAEYADAMALYPKLRLTDCDGLSLYLGNCAASAFFERCTINTLTAPKLQGELAFSNCHFQPDLRAVEGSIYALESTLGTRFTNCTLHAPLVNGERQPELVNQSGVVTINGGVRHYHLNTTLGNDILEHLQRSGVTLEPVFVSKLKLHHALED
ncbi:MAG: hypothetical protein ACYC63_00395 [Armatimonadota bacterium]